MPLDRPPPFRRLLIANRGEIAVRIIRSCAELGIASVAVYSDADRGALHTRLADEAHRIGPGPASESYLRIDAILAVARTTRSEAIHPGYGFLSEDATFAERCVAAGLTWIGPPALAMRLTGDKATARRLAADHGVPIVPGYDGDDQADEAFIAASESIGFPLLVKAAGGGGGRGMRVVAEPSALPDALASARREAQASFGSDRLILEHLVEGARHVEVQVLGDRHGRLIQLGERDCSVQRRHQKVIEESPAPGLSAELRRALGEAAVTVARAAGYTNAGTCEFLVDAHERFWFIEMNARLQVEHPVTELVTGIDLVRHQIEIAAGRPLTLREEDVRSRGHAVECRIYAEDPTRDFMPSTGRIERLRAPDGPGLRHDLGYADGDVLPPYYDAMLGKLIAYAEDRDGAITRAREALDKYVVEGVTINRALLAWILDHPSFRAGAATTNLLADEWHPPSIEPAPPIVFAVAAARQLSPSNRPDRGTGSPWQNAWSIARQGMVLILDSPDEPGRAVAVRADADGPDTWLLSADDTHFRAVVQQEGVTIQTEGSGAGSARYRVSRLADGLDVELDGRHWRVRIAPPPAADPVTRRSATGEQSALEAPMPGRVVRVDAQVGGAVAEHQPLVVLEAMKIEHVVASPRAGIVRAVRCAVGDTVISGQVLIELEPA